MVFFVFKGVIVLLLIIELILFIVVLILCDVDWYFVGKYFFGMMKVVVLGLKLKKNCVRIKIVRRFLGESLLYVKFIMMKRIVRILKFMN